MSDALAAARARALSSPLRWRILRLCLHEPRTNLELATLLHLNAGTMLHHVRTLVDTGYLAAQPARRGARGAKEVPYLATRLTWEQDDIEVDLVSTFVALLTQEIAAADPEQVQLTRLGVRLRPDDRQEFTDRLSALLREFNGRDSPDGEPWSLMTFAYPDNQGVTTSESQP